jgi:SAM-dependent methyltransferase
MTQSAPRLFSALNKDNVLHAFSLLFYPEMRDRGLERLKELGVLADDAAANVRRALGNGSYRDHGLFDALAPVKLNLDYWTRWHTYNQLRPTMPLDQVAGYRSAWPAAFSARGLRGKDVMDFGAGDFSPLSLAILLYVNGARSVVAFEPAGWRLDYTQAAVGELVADILSNPGAYNFGYPGDPRVLTRRLTEISLEAIGPRPVLDLGPIQVRRTFSFDEGSAAFDLILSTSVFEHVRSFDAEIANHLKALRRGGVSINRVDFTDHRHGQPELWPFGFYEDGVTYGCNLLRVSDLADAARRLGARFQMRDALLADEAVLDRVRLLERFRGYSRESLRTMTATLVLRA